MCWWNAIALGRLGELGLPLLLKWKARNEASDDSTNGGGRMIQAMWSPEEILVRTAADMEASPYSNWPGSTGHERGRQFMVGV